MRKKIIAIIVLAIMTGMFTMNAFADSGGWISGGTTGGGGSSGGGGGGGGGCSGDAGYYDLWCQGYSWIFYKYVGGASNSSAINFRKDETNNEISKSCSEHGEAGGFWHLGYNMRALSYNGIGYFGDLTQNNDLYSSDYTYATSSGGYGHAQTFDYKTIRDEYTYVYGERYITHSNSNLSHDIYKNGVKMYTASKYGSESEVLKAYQQAYSVVYPTSSTPTELPDNVYAFCWWPDMDGSSFQGTSRVMKGDKSWNNTPSNERMQPDPLWYPDSKGTKQKTADTLTIQDCDPIDGCLISFRHYLKRTSGDDSTKYTITRNVNGVTSTINGNVENNGVNKDNLIQLHPVTIFPGQKVCETLSFYADGKSDKVSTTVCAAAVATRGAELSVEIRDQKSSAKYQNWRKDYVYAKPTDDVDVKGAYTPRYQDMYGLTLPGKSKTNGFQNNGKTIGETFNANINPDWNNVFSIRLGEDCRKDIAGGVGSSVKYGENDTYSFRITNSSVGKQDVKAVTNACANAKNTPKQVSLTYSDKNWFAATVDLNVGESNVAEVYVPYNFINETNIADVDGIVYAGEKTSIPYSVTTKLKPNEELNDTYATMVDGAGWKLEYCYGAPNTNCNSVDGASEQKLHYKGGSDNYIYEEETISDESTTARFNIPDVPAGTKVWVRSAVYPKDSGTDKNIRADYYDKNNPNSWAYSEWVELTVAKKPSFQVWGGSVYSAGEIDIPIANKTNLAGYGEVAYTFGSWTELGLVADGLVKGLASGAGLGYARNDGGELWPNYTFMSNGVTTNYVGDGNNNYVSNTNLPGGSEGEDFCRMSTLSFANVDCINGSVGNLNKESLSSSANSNKSALIAKFNDTESAEYTLEQHNEILDSYNIGAMEIAKGETKIITVQNGTAKINGNIKYTNDSYTTMAEIPKLIIYAKNIEIDCAVERIDAVLIADGSVNTCNSGDVNLQQNSTQLKINGSVVSDTIDLNRTYGAATGANSIIPAEIVNYDTSLYLWANQRSDITKTGKIMTAYQHELSPRY